ncbi:MAG TPA: hypothetical protein VIH46_05570 [Candidatus Acidoferrales bacterium]
MKSALRTTIILLIATLGLTVALADGVRTWSAARDCESKSPVVADALPSVLATPELGLGVGFAMADFTGDTHPDLATVELNRLDSVGARYLIAVQFSEGGHQFLQLTAPFGGLLINAEDVTGDGNVDLVIRAARSGAPVTIFINDGHGHFTAAEPSGFANVLPETAPGQKFATEHFYFSATLVSPRSNTIRSQSGATRNPDAQEVSLVRTNRYVPLHPFLPFGLDRAPPAAA